MMVMKPKALYLLVQDYIEAREASGSVRTAGPKDLTVTLAIDVYWASVPRTHQVVSLKPKKHCPRTDAAHLPSTDVGVAPHGSV
jgi:hypothetical protein